MTEETLQLQVNLADLVGGLFSQPYSQVAPFADRLLFFDASEIGEKRIKGICPIELLQSDTLHQQRSVDLSAIAALEGVGFLFRVGVGEAELVSFTGSGDVVRSTQPVLINPLLGDAQCHSLNGLSIQASGCPAFIIANSATLLCDTDAIVRGCNTGDQTFSLHGAIQGSGDGVIRTTLTHGAVEFSHIQEVTGPVLIGRVKGKGVIQTLGVGATLCLKGDSLETLGATGEFKTKDNKTVTVKDGVITSITSTGR